MFVREIQIAVNLYPSAYVKLLSYECLINHCFLKIFNFYGYRWVIIEVMALLVDIDESIFNYSFCMIKIWLGILTNHYIILCKTKKSKVPFNYLEFKPNFCLKNHTCSFYYIMIAHRLDIFNYRKYFFISYYYLIYYTIYNITWLLLTRYAFIT